MRVSLKNLLAVLLIVAGIDVNQTQCFDDDLARVTAKLPFNLKQIELPRIPSRTIKLTDFGGVGDRTVQNTAAFVKAIDACAKAGGGRVVVPEGIWLTGPIQLKSNIDLHLERGAVIQFSARFEDYPLVKTTWEGSPAVRRMSPIYGIQLVNVSITGRGEIIRA
jgi:polygalacturonase